MDISDFYAYGLLLIPFLGVILAGYGKLRVGPFFGITVAAGAISVLLTYLLFDLGSALIQLGALAVGSLLFLLSIGVFGEKFSYRSPMLLLAALALLPVGLMVSSNYYGPLIAFGVLMGLNLIFALLLVWIRRNATVDRKGRPKAKNRYLLTVPTILIVLTVDLMLLNGFGQGIAF